MNSDLVDRTLNALERLMRMFQIERILFLLTAFVSFALLVYASYRLFSTDVVRTQDIAIICGASGASAAASMRIAYFLNKAFNLIEFLVKSLDESRRAASGAPPNTGPSLDLAP